MAAILHQLDQRRLIDSNGIADGSSIYFYVTGTLTPAPVYTTAALDVEHPSPIVVAAGAAVPDIYLDSSITYRRRIVYGDGSVDDTDPWEGGIVRGSDLASTDTGKGAGMVAFKQDGDDATDRDVLAKLRETVSVLDFGAVGDGTTDDTAAIQAALWFCGGVTSNDDITATITPKNNVLFIPPGDYLTDTLYVPPGVRVLGAGGTSESSINTATRLIQNGSGDVLRFIAYTGSSLRYWWGEIADLAIWGDTSQTSGWAINFKTAANELVIPQDSNFLHHLTIRACYEGGINLPSGAFPLCISDCKFLFNNGPGIKLTRVTNFQGVHFLNISGDGNNGGIISLNSLNDGFGSVLITNLKSEARVNSDYGGVECQTSAIVCTSCNDLPLVINGATHISSIPDGAVYKKPGDLVSCPSGGTPPQLTWSGVAIRVRGTDTGADPKIIGGATISPTIASAAYTVTAGYFNQTVRLFNARIAQSRVTATDGDTTPTVAKHNCLLLNNTSATTITTFDDGIEGQEIFLIANNGNTTLKNGATMQLAGSADFAMTGNDTCTLVYISSVWREKCRSVN